MNTNAIIAREIAEALPTEGTDKHALCKACFKAGYTFSDLRDAVYKWINPYESVKEFPNEVKLLFLLFIAEAEAAL